MYIKVYISWHIFSPLQLLLSKIYMYCNSQSYRIIICSTIWNNESDTCCMKWWTNFDACLQSYGGVVLISLLALVPLKANHSHQPYRDKRSGSMFYIVHCAILRPAHQRVLGAIAQQKMKTAMFRYNLSELVVWKSETHSTSPLPFQAHNMYTHTQHPPSHTCTPPPLLPQHTKHSSMESTVCTLVWCLIHYWLQVTKKVLQEENNLSGQTETGDECLITLAESLPYDAPQQIPKVGWESIVTCTIECKGTVWNSFYKAEYTEL